MTTWKPKVFPGAVVDFKAAFAPPGTPAHLLERAAAIVTAAEAHGVPENIVYELPVYREVRLRIDWNARGVALDAVAARIIVAATSPNPRRAARVGCNVCGEAVPNAEPHVCKPGSNS